MTVTIAFEGSRDVGKERRGVYTRNIKSHPKVSSKDQFYKNEEI